MRAEEFTQQASLEDPERLINLLGQIEGERWVREQLIKITPLSVRYSATIYRQAKEYQKEMPDSTIRELMYDLDSDSVVIYGAGGYNRYAVGDNGLVYPIDESFPNKEKLQLAKKLLSGSKAMKITEITLPKNVWELIISNADKHEVGTELVDLVKNAYSVTPRGSMVNSLKDVIPSDWHVIDWDPDPDVDATIFYRYNRPGERWEGRKIQGIGHDGTRTSKNKAIAKLNELLSEPGCWIESSDALRHVLKKLNSRSITNERFLQKLFNDPDLYMVDQDTYIRELGDGATIRETVFGRPKLK
jgi:hypothetical protein